MIDEIQTEAKTGMEKAVAHAIDEFASIRTGRANPSLKAVSLRVLQARVAQWVTKSA